MQWEPLKRIGLENKVNLAREKKGLLSQRRNGWATLAKQVRA